MYNGGTKIGKNAGKDTKNKPILQKTRFFYCFMGFVECFLMPKTSKWCKKWGYVGVVAQ